MKNKREKGTAMQLSFNTTEEEAIRLVAYHLEMAAVYFEATPEDEGVGILSHLSEGPTKDASRKFLESLDEYYKNLD